MTKVMGYIVMLFVGIVIGMKSCTHYQTDGKIQQMRNEKTTSCLVIKKDKELTVN